MLRKMFSCYENICENINLFHILHVPTDYLFMTSSIKLMASLEIINRMLLLHTKSDQRQNWISLFQDFYIPLLKGVFLQPH